MRSALATSDWPALLASGPDMVCFDLEDGTAAAHKRQARDAVSAFLHTLVNAQASANTAVYVRINSPRTRAGIEDLLMIADSPSSLTGILIPKAESGTEVALVAQVLADAKRTMEIVPLVETQAGVHQAQAIAASDPAVSAIFLGSVDLSGELGSNTGWDALYGARSALVFAASQRGIDCIDGPWLDVDDTAGLELEAQRVADMGFTGKACYDSIQIDTIHAAFTPSSAAIKTAEAIVAAVSASATGAARVDGQSVNKANAKAAERVLALARRRDAV